ncbi:hypothetical protein C8R44DRAFT_99200 [Mycena epipterygia]|nr:hypothetical protein C8R44DRAFT_99200 [Mycena epipterygia]
MGGSDTFCSITGAMHFSHVRAFPEVLEDIIADRILDIPPAILSGLVYSQEDVDASRDFVMLAQCTTEADGTQTISDSPGPLSNINTTNIMVVYDVVPTMMSYYGGYTDADDSSVYYNVTPGSPIVTHSSFVILRDRFPDFHPHILYKVLNSPRFWLECDLGPGGRVRDQCVAWLKVANIPEGEGEDEWWAHFLTQKDKSVTEILHDAWMGRGNMWAFVRPDRFPIAESLACKPLAKFAAPEAFPTASSLDSLPLDIYQEISAYLTSRGLVSLIAINKRLRAALVPQMDQLFFHHIVANEPYLFPADEVECYRGSEELGWWDEGWKKGGLEEDDTIPWMAYAKACASSASMRKRKRIWWIIGQMEAIARAEGLFDAIELSYGTETP